MKTQDSKNLQHPEGLDECVCVCESINLVFNDDDSGNSF